MKTLIQLLQIFSPKLVAKIAYGYMSRPRVRKPRDTEQSVLDASDQSQVQFNDFEIQKYEWGQQFSKTALIVHGWEGAAGNFAPLVDILLGKGYRVVAFDAPSHGLSSKGKTTMFAFAEFLESQWSKLNPQLVISHSFGSVNTATVLRNNPEFSLDKWIMVTTPYRFMDRVNGVSNHLGVNSKVTSALIKLIQQDTKEDINELNMATYCSELSSVKEATIVHSKSDKVLPVEGARRVAASFRNSTLIEFENLGHYSILWSDELGEIVSQKA